MIAKLTKLTAGAPQFLHPKLRLFLSVDIVGSTAYKQAHHSVKAGDPIQPIEPWVGMVTHFYRNFPIIFFTEYEKFKDKYSRKGIENWVQPSSPTLWKAAGDELIYTITITDYRQTALFILAWQDAIKQFRRTLKGFSKKLNLKGSAWLAGFPVNNTEVIFDFNRMAGESSAGSHFDASDENMLNLFSFYTEKNGVDSNSTIIDYIGPSIDIGFRLGAFSTPRHLICSVELVWILCQALKDRTIKSICDLSENCEENSKVFHFSGRHLLKGVLDGVPYPIFWIDIGEHKNFNSAEDKISNCPPLETNAVEQYCEEFIDSCEAEYMIRPFSLGKHTPPHHLRSDGYLEKYNLLLTHWSKIYASHLASIPQTAENLVDPINEEESDDVIVSDLIKFAQANPSPQDGA